MTGIVERIDQMENIAEDGICPLCLDLRNEEVELNEVKKKQANGRTHVRASCPNCSFETARNHDQGGGGS
jgi:hypothetical protein